MTNDALSRHRRWSWSLASMSPFTVLVALSLSLFSLAATQLASAACRMEQSSNGLYQRHLARACSEPERDARAIPAAEVLAALKAGQGLDLEGVTLTGDLKLDALPETSLNMAELPSLELREVLRDVSRVRVISGPITIRNSVVCGMITTNPKEGYLLVSPVPRLHSRGTGLYPSGIKHIPPRLHPVPQLLWDGVHRRGFLWYGVKGPVTMTGTTFERPADFSRTIFLGAVDFSDAVFLQEAFFIMARFEQPARFEKTAFGVHSRFHKARFAESASFVRAGFNGLAEFLQVTFEKEASFSRAYFKMGTGFSGSRFRGPLDFSEAVFERAVFFTFTVFEGDAYFRRTAFRADVNFSDAEFKGLDDFSKAFFNVEPRFTRAKASGVRSSSGLQNPRLLYTIAAALFVFAVIFVFILRKR